MKEDTRPVVRFKRLSEYATVPTRGSDEAAGMDLYFDASGHMKDGAEFDPDGNDNKSVFLEPLDRALLHTNIAAHIPTGHYGRIAPRSGLALKNGIDVMAGVVDSDYRGELGIILINLSGKTQKISHGDRIAQLIIEKYSPCRIMETDDLTKTVRGAGGYGSTGR